MLWPWLWLRPRDEAAPGTTAGEATTNLAFTKANRDHVDTEDALRAAAEFEAASK